MICIGHRGAMGHAPENTLLSVQTALNMGVDWIEVDVYVVEGELVVIHDPTLERTTNGSGQVMEQSLTYLRQLDAGEGQQIPLLQEIFDLVDKRMGINIELKGPETAVPTVHFIQHQLNHGWSPDQILVSSFDHNMLLQVQQLDARIKLGALIFYQPDTLAQFAQELGVYAVHPWVMTLTEAFVRDAHERGLKLFVYTVNEPDDMARLASWGVDGIFTDYPDRFLKLWHARSSCSTDKSDCQA